MTPVVPFDPDRTPAGQVRLSLLDAYSDSTIRSFVEKLRALAAVSPDTCAERFSALDAELTTMLEDARRANAPVRVDRSRLATLVDRLGTKRPAALAVLERLLTDMLEPLRRGGAE